MQLSNIEFIDHKLLEIRNLLREDDAYYVNDMIISHIDDPDLEELINEMMEGYDYTPDMIEKVDVIIREIQAKLSDEQNI